MSISASGRRGLLLYKRILRAHQQLPPHLSEIGNKFVRAEFDQHRTVTDPQALTLFFSEWDKYLDTISMQTSPPPVQKQEEEEDIKFGEKLGKSVSEFSGEQAIRILNLKEEIDQQANKDK